MKYSQALVHGMKPDQECINEDSKLDDSNGPLTGKVRWAERPKEPGGDETEMF